jgi:clan AA aspartic protease
MCSTIRDRRMLPWKATINLRGIRSEDAMPATPAGRPRTKPKRTTTMGRVTTEVLIENFDDLWAVRRRQLAAKAVRQVLVPDALVDTGATSFSVPTKIIKELGLEKLGKRRVRTAGGVRLATTYSPVNITIQGRSCFLEVTEVPNDMPVLIGQIPLEQLDFVVDPCQQKLIGNPAHGGEHMHEMYWTSSRGVRRGGMATLISREARRDRL